ncbi:MAG TPA: HD domain-containing protein [Acidimicrobiales bacterium]|nr:HD domain-containing protein [Acidimicrobiales bacterium]
MLTDRFDDALVFASDVHRDHVRKATGVPYVSHLLAVASLALEAGAGEDVAIAALLHDCVEDCHVTIAQLRARFGDAVASIVDEVTETDEDPKPPWRPRKDAYLAHLETASPGALVVSAADKLHNVRTMLVELRSAGTSLWSRFHAGPDEQVWFHRSVADVIARRLPGPLADALSAAVDDLAAAIAASSRP